MTITYASGARANAAVSLKFRRVNGGYLAGTVLSAMLLACSGHEGIDAGAAGVAGGPGNEPVAQTTEAITSCGCNSSSYTFVEAPFVGPSASTHICWPTGYYGQPVGTTSPNFRVVRNANGNWVAENFGAMGCVPQCCFYSNGGNSDVRWLSQGYVASVLDSTVGDGGIGGITNMWNGDAMPILAGMNHTGAAMKPDEYASASPRLAPDTGAVLVSEPAMLAAVAHRTTVPVGTQAFGYSFFVGLPQTGHKVKKKTYSLKTNGPISMISDASGICTFSSLAKAVPTGHPVLYTVSGVWKAEWVGTPGSATISCYYFNQDQ